MKSIVVTIDEPTLAGIDRIARSSRADARGRQRQPNRSRVVRQALQEFVLRQERLAREDEDRAALSAHRDRLHRQAAALVRGQAEP